MSYLNFSNIKTYSDLQDAVFSLDIPYQIIEEKYDLELAYQNKFNENFDWQKFEKINKEEIKMTMDLGEVVPPGTSNRNQQQDRGKDLDLNPSHLQENMMDQEDLIDLELQGMITKMIVKKIDLNDQ